MRTAICCFLVVLFFPAGVTLADERGRAEQMLEAYEKTVGRMTAFHIEGMLKEWNNLLAPNDLEGEFHETRHFTIFHDDFRWRIARVDRRHPPPDRPPLIGNEYRFDQFLGERQGVNVLWISNKPDEPSQPDRLVVALPGVPRGDEHVRYLGWLRLLFGLTSGDAGQPVWTVMRDAAQLELLPDTELIAEHRTYVVKSHGKFGTHTLWLDPEFGFLPRQIVINKQGGHLFNEIQLGVEQSRSAPLSGAPANYTIEEARDRIDSVQLGERQGHFVITAFDHLHERTVKHSDSTKHTKQRVEYRTQTINFEQEAWPANAFQFAIDIPNGTRVRSSDQTKSYVWRDGKIE